MIWSVYRDGEDNIDLSEEDVQSIISRMKVEGKVAAAQKPCALWTIYSNDPSSVF